MAKSEYPKDFVHRATKDTRIVNDASEERTAKFDGYREVVKKAEPKPQAPQNGGSK